MINKKIKELEREIEEIEKAKNKIGKQPYILKSLKKLTDGEKREVMDWCKNQVKITNNLKEKGVYIYDLEKLKIKLQLLKELSSEIEKEIDEWIYGKKGNLCGEINIDNVDEFKQKLIGDRK